MVIDQAILLDCDTIPHNALRKRVIPGLDAMRAIAITLVVAYHLGAPVSGSLGVMIYFVLSGFLITSLLLKEIRRSGTVSLRNFYRRRAFRIFPAFYLCWVVTTLVVVFVWHQPVIWKQTMASFFYLANYARAVLPGVQQVTFHMGISWSLAIEEQFYLIWSFTLIWIMYKPHRAGRVVGGTIWTIWLWRALLMLRFGVGWSYAYNAFDTRADALMVGSLLAIVLYGDAIPSYLFALVSKKWLAIIPIVALAAVSYLDLHTPHSLYLQLFNFSLAPVFTAVVLLQWVFWGWAVLEHWAAKWVARLSYSIYLYHPIVLGFMGHIPVRHGQRLLAIPLILAVASASCCLIERPFMRMRGNHETKR